ncbi:PhzF family phenazine biosynthesis protein [Vibrio sp. EA2]|uniref:PhzF family phenazine biosynthesis protein n=1 Tax=Vibrio sp. EA2 TaxID=3079860 RepID=UPI00294A434B|nr:PhzF family phenazine biosynthesis protein [Vibrio sp. EA2]MDV6249765.1 PhzF family phenazine biosynthesis protein [Vibrio sp. EA2]
MELDIYVVDAFTDAQFKGNSAAVVPVTEWLAPELMQNIAAENNLSETAFIKPIGDNQYEIRWFSPITEIDFCGHATLASSKVLFDQLNVEGTIEFHTLEVGKLSVVKNAQGKIEMTFPVRPPQPVSVVPKELIEGLSCKVERVLLSPQAYFVIVEDQQEVLDVQYQSDQLKQLAPYDVVVTASGSDYDFVSRYFWPANGGDEDPVTGSIHAGLAPFWAEELGKSSLVAYQASSRGGVLHCQVCDDRVNVSGDGVMYLKGKVFV